MRSCEQRQQCSKDRQRHLRGDHHVTTVGMRTDERTRLLQKQIKQKRVDKYKVLNGLKSDFTYTSFTREKRPLAAQVTHETVSASRQIRRHSRPAVFAASTHREKPNLCNLVVEEQAAHRKGGKEGCMARLAGGPEARRELASRQRDCKKLSWKLFL